MVSRIDSARFINISMDIYEDMKIYKNRLEKRPIIRSEVREVPSYLFESKIDINLHTGTHIDFPRHVMSNGKTSSDYLKDWKYFYKALIIEIDDDILEINSKILSNYEFPDKCVVIFKTIFSKTMESIVDFPYITKDGADYLSKKNIFAVGIDSLGIERNQANHPTHKAFLSKDILIIEGLDLKNIKGGNYNILITPIKIMDVEALPISVLLI